jgi:hypothetical protein
MQRVMLDKDTGQHYLVVTTRSPWNTDPLTRVYATDSFGRMTSVEGMSNGTPRMVCGGWYTMTRGIGDLTQRLMTGTILSQQESDALDSEMVDRDTEAFRSYIQPTVTTE